MEAIAKQWQAERKDMDAEGMYVNALVNSTVFVRALCDNGCSVVALVSERFTQRKKLYSFPISPRLLY